MIRFLKVIGRLLSDFTIYFVFPNSVTYTENSAD